MGGLLLLRFIWFYCFMCLGYCGWGLQARLCVLVGLMFGTFVALIFLVDLVVGVYLI